jgi:hypothetical protein
MRPDGRVTRATLALLVALSALATRDGDRSR